MDLLEYQGKQLFAKHGVPVPDGRPATTVQEAVEAAEQLGYPVVIKAQVQIGGGGEGGGVKLGDDPREIEEEYYAAIVFDRSAKKPMAMLSKMGGMDVEEVAETDPEAMRMLHVDPLLGLQDFHGRRLAFGSGIAEDVIRPVGSMLAKLYDVFVREEAPPVEVNPLLVTKSREVVALDAKVTSAVEVILSDDKVRAVLFNIFGGITRCDEVAKGLIEAFEQIKPDVPFVVRLDGTNDKEGRALLAEANLPNVHTEATMLGAAEKVVELAG